MILTNAVVRGAAEASAATEAIGETDKGFGNYLMAIGVVETVALFVLMFIQAAL